MKSRMELVKSLSSELQRVKELKEEWESAASAKEEERERLQDELEQLRAYNYRQAGWAAATRLHSSVHVSMLASTSWALNTWTHAVVQRPKPAELFTDCAVLAAA